MTELVDALGVTGCKMYRATNAGSTPAPVTKDQHIGDIRVCSGNRTARCRMLRQTRPCKPRGEVTHSGLLLNTPLF